MQQSLEHRVAGAKTSAATLLWLHNMWLWLHNIRLCQGWGAVLKGGVYKTRPPPVTSQVV